MFDVQLSSMEFVRIGLESTALEVMRQPRLAVRPRSRGHRRECPEAACSPGVGIFRSRYRFIADFAIPSRRDFVMLSMSVELQRCWWTSSPAAWHRRPGRLGASPLASRRARLEP